MSDLQQFRQQLTRDDHLFADTLAFIERHYTFTPGAFVNNGLASDAGQNEGSRRTLGLAQLEGFSQEEALLAFAEHYRSVLATPDGQDHGNIRALLKGSLAGVHFDQAPLSRR